MKQIKLNISLKLDINSLDMLLMPYVAMVMVRQRPFLIIVFLQLILQDIRAFVDSVMEEWKMCLKLVL